MVSETQVNTMSNNNEYAIAVCEIYNKRPTWI